MELTEYFGRISLLSIIKNKESWIQMDCKLMNVKWINVIYIIYRFKQLLSYKTRLSKDSAPQISPIIVEGYFEMVNMSFKVSSIFTSSSLVKKKPKTAWTKKMSDI